MTERWKKPGTVRASWKGGRTIARVAYLTPDRAEWLDKWTKANKTSLGDIVTDWIDKMRTREIAQRD